MSKVVEFIGGRKVLLVLVVFLVSTVLMIYSGLTDKEWSHLVKLLIIAYPAGNVIQKIAIKKTIAISTDDTIKRDLIGRKFTGVILIYSTVAVLTGFDIVSGDTYVSLTEWLVSVYIASNISSKVKT